MISQMDILLYPIHLRLNQSKKLLDHSENILLL